MQHKMTLEIWLCIGLIGLSIAALLTIGMAEDSASTFLLRQERSMGTLDYQTLPRISAIALIMLSIANILLLSYKNRNTVEQNENPTIEPRQNNTVLWRTVGTSIVLLLYTLVLPHTPFFLSTALFLGLLFWLYGLPNWKKNMCIACIGAAFFWIVFVYISSLAL